MVFTYGEKTVGPWGNIPSERGAADAAAHFLNKELALWYKRGYTFIVK